MKGDVHISVRCSAKERWTASCCSAETIAGDSSGKRCAATAVQCLRACPVREVDGEVHADVSVLTASTAAPPPKRTLRDLPGPPSVPLLGSAPARSSAGALAARGVVANARDAFAYRPSVQHVVVVSEMDAMVPVFLTRAKSPPSARNKLRYGGVIAALRPVLTDSHYSSACCVSRSACRTPVGLP